MIASLITTLRANDIEPTAEELADALWFAMQIKSFVASVSEKIPQSPQSEPVDSPISYVQPQKPPISTELSEKPLKPEPQSTSIETPES